MGEVSTTMTIRCHMCGAAVSKGDYVTKEDDIICELCALKLGFIHKLQWSKGAWMQLGYVDLRRMKR